MTTLKHKYTAKAVTILLMEFFFYMVLMINASEKSGSEGGSPPASVDCSTLSLNMEDCLSFLTRGSTAETPQGACCSGLKLELKADAECFCEGLRNTAQFGLTLNISRAVGLPAACHVLAPTVSDCALNYNLLGRSPAESPRPSTPKPSSREDPSTTTTPDFVSPPPPSTSSSFRSYSHHVLLLLFIFYMESW